MTATADKHAWWLSYMDGLAWTKGQLDVSSWWTFLRAASCGVTRNEALDAVCARIRGAGGAVRSGKLESQCRRAYEHVATSPAEGSTWTPRLQYRKPERPAYDAAKLRAFAADWAPHVDAAWLGNRSSVDPATVDAEQFLDAIYEIGENILAFSDFKSQGQFLWTRIGEKSYRHHWLALPAGVNPLDGAYWWDELSGPEGVWFLAQPVDGREHPNPRTGRMSRRSEESVTSWRYLVLESDQAAARDWLGALVQLPLRIVAIYTSGGKSIHALIRLDAKSKAHWDAERDALAPALVTLGGDPAALTAVRLTRLPGCHRSGRLQKLLYLQPRASGLLPICALPPKRDVVADWTRYAESCASAEPADDEDGGEWRVTVRRAVEFYGLEKKMIQEEHDGHES